MQRLIFIIFLLSTIILFTFAFVQNTLGLPEISIPEDNPQTLEKIALGQKLFEDRRFSADGVVSCSHCHIAGKAFTDGFAVPRGFRGLQSTRNVPTVINAAFYKGFFLDGRRNSLEDQALDPFVNPVEHGLSNHEPVLDVVRSDPDYTEQFKTVFDTDSEQITIDHVVKAIASFERTLVAGDSPFDRYFFGGDKGAMSESSIRGLEIFRQKGNCVVCHEISWDHALFTDNNYYNLGVGYELIESKIPALIQKLKAKEDSNYEEIFTEEELSELGRFNVTKLPADIGKFKNTNLRNIALTAPYMHDGSIDTLEEVVEFYNQGGQPNPFLDPSMFPLNLTEQEKADLVEFLYALTSSIYN